MIGARRLESHCSIAIPRRLPHVQCDPVRVREIYSNLLANAMKYKRNADVRIEVGYIGALEPAGCAAARAPGASRPPAAARATASRRGRGTSASTTPRASGGWAALDAAVRQAVGAAARATIAARFGREAGVARLLAVYRAAGAAV